MKGEEADEVAVSTVGTLIDSILVIIHERTVSDLAKPYAARRCKEQLSCLVESHFLNRDAGEPVPEEWLPDEGALGASCCAHASACARVHLGVVRADSG